MLRRIRWIATAAAAAMVVVFVVVTLTRNNTYSQNSSNRLVPAPLAIGDALQKPYRVPSVPLLDEHGKVTSLRAFKGKWVVLSPAMTLCHEVCPMTSGVFDELEQQLRKDGLASRVDVAEVTVDPWRDRPARLRAYKKMTGARFRMLTGSVPNILALWKRLGIAVERIPLEKPAPIDWFTHKPETLNIAHGDGLFIIDPSGQVLVVGTGMPKIEAGQALPASLHRLLDAEGVHNYKHPEAPWTASEIVLDLKWGMGLEVRASTLEKTSAPSRQEAEEELAGSPGSLASLHEQAGKLIGSAMAIKQRIASLHGYPVVVNVWASWCGPCRQEFPLFAAASAQFGRKVAFLGYDSNDEAGAARAFLKDHPISYPSYEGASTDIGYLTPIQGTPTTIFLSPTGKVLDVHIGYYKVQSALDADLERYALGK